MSRFAGRKLQVLFVTNGDHRQSQIVQPVVHELARFDRFVRETYERQRLPDGRVVDVPESFFFHNFNTKTQAEITQKVISGLSWGLFAVMILNIAAQ